VQRTGWSLLCGIGSLAMLPLFVRGLFLILSMHELR
jgi:hypothetical protein